jgi:hypothetical protein
VLDNSHIALAYGPDQSYIFDSISTPDPNASISVDDNIRTNYETSDPKGVEIDILLENNTVLFGLTNTRPFYTYGTLTTSMINTYEEQLLLLPPSQKTTIAKPLDESLLEDDFVYTVPVVAQFNDVEASTTFEVTTGNTGGNNDQGSLPQCTPVFIFALLLILAVKH